MKLLVWLILPGICLAGCEDGPGQGAAGTDTAMVAASRPGNLDEQVIYQRAFQAVVWGMPAVNYQLMYQEMADKVKGRFNQVVYWSGLLNWKNQTLTPNPDVIYLMPFFNTKEVGPVVLEIPPAGEGTFNGSVMDYWQAAIEDVGPGGVDKGKGGKYLFLPPGYPKEKIPAGYIPLPSATYLGYALLRSVLKSGSAADVATAVNYARKIKVYPLSQAANPPATVFLDAQDVVYDSAIPYDLRFFQSLDKMIQAEPWLQRDRVMIEQLKSIGIEKGKTFQPDAKQEQVLNKAIKDAKLWLDENYERMPPFYAGTHWFFPATEEFHQNILNGFGNPDSYPVDNRGTVYAIAFFSAKHLGESQYYLLTTRDKDGQPLNGKSAYRLNVPAKVPVTQYWSITVYNRATHTFIRNVDRQGRSSQSPGLQVNADGSVDLYFGPAAPAGKESNWVPTDANGDFELLARFYGPQKALFDKSWKLTDMEEVK